MADPPENDRQSSGDPGRRAGGFPAVRAGVLLIVFVVATVIVLGEIHTQPTKTASTAAPVVATSTSTSISTSTTKPAHRTGHTTTTTTVAAVPPSQVPVLVANGSGKPGAAAAISTQLKAAGWDTLPAVNASADVPTSHVYYAPGFQPEATNIATTLHLTSSVVAPYSTAVPISSIGTAEVVVVAGPDLTGAATAPTTSTTAATAATSTTVG